MRDIETALEQMQKPAGNNKNPAIKKCSLIAINIPTTIIKMEKIRLLQVVKQRSIQITEKNGSSNNRCQSSQKDAPTQSNIDRRGKLYQNW